MEKTNEINLNETQAKIDNVLFYFDATNNVSFPLFSKIKNNFSGTF